MDWFVLTLSGILGCVFLFVSLYLFALYSHPADKGVFNSIITKFIIVVAIFITWLPSLLLPLDAANAESIDITLNMSLCWNIVFMTIGSLIFVILPAFILFYESDEEDSIVYFILKGEKNMSCWDIITFLVCHSWLSVVFVLLFLANCLRARHWLHRINYDLANQCRFLYLHYLLHFVHWMVLPGHVRRGRTCRTTHRPNKWLYWQAYLIDLETSPRKKTAAQRYLSSHDFRGRVIEGGGLWSEESLGKLLFKTKSIEGIWEKEESVLEISSSFWENSRYLQNGIRFHEHQPLLMDRQIDHRNFPISFQYFNLAACAFHGSFELIHIHRLKLSQWCYDLPGFYLNFIFIGDCYRGY